MKERSSVAIPGLCFTFYFPALGLYIRLQPCIFVPVVQASKEQSAYKFGKQLAKRSLLAKKLISVRKRKITDKGRIIESSEIAILC